MTDTERERQPDTTTYDSIPVETGKNDGDGTSGDLISRTQAIDEIHEDAEWLASQGSDWQTERMERDKSILMSLPSVQPETNCSEIPNSSEHPEVIRCKDCIYQTESWIGIKYCEAHGDHIGKDYDYCSNARRKENGQTDFTASGD